MMSNELGIGVTSIIEAPATDRILSGVTLSVPPPCPGRHTSVGAQTIDGVRIATRIIPVTAYPHPAR